MKFFVTAPRGVERVLAEELRELGAGRVRAVAGGVELGGRWEDAFRVCLESRIALRVLFPLADAPCQGARDLYATVRAIAWEKHVRPESTLAVSAVGRVPGLDNTMFVAQRTKDAVADRLRALTGARPAVDREDPDVSVFVRLARGRVTVALDLAGASLHRRGYREPGAAAPLKETLAAALLRLAGWDRRRPLVDPMCGSGTLPIEADLWARDVAPGLARQRFGFERWASFDRSLEKRWQLLRARALERARPAGPEVLGFDRDGGAVALARRNAARAGAQVRLARADLASFRGTDPAGLVITNPPYGTRLAAGRALYTELGEALAHLAPGHRVAVLLGPASPFRPPPGAARHEVKNGDLSCVLAVWDVRARHA